MKDHLANVAKVMHRIWERSSRKKSSSMLAAAANIGINLEDDADDDNGNIFYDAIANAFDHSQRVRKYFHDDRSRTQSDNKRLWLLRYQSYKEFGI
jgi:hypothetical protein